jgi:hypothetical protein
VGARGWRRALGSPLEEAAWHQQGNGMQWHACLLDKNSSQATSAAIYTRAEDTSLCIEAMAAVLLDMKQTVAWPTPDPLNASPASLHFCTMSTKYCCSAARSDSNFSTVSMSTCRQGAKQQYGVLDQKAAVLAQGMNTNTNTTHTYTLGAYPQNKSKSTCKAHWLWLQ